VTRADLIERISEKRHMIRSLAELLVDTIFDCLKESIRRGERVELRRFGTFGVSGPFRSGATGRSRGGILEPARSSRSSRSACLTSRSALNSRCGSTKGARRN
jgi:Bacterial DNA-binding protein